MQPSRPAQAWHRFTPTPALNRNPPFPSLPTLAQVVSLERRLPYDISEGMDRVSVVRRPETLHDSGVEGLTFQFKWELYAGHHLVGARGWGWLAAQAMRRR